MTPPVENDRDPPVEIKTPPVEIILLTPPWELCTVILSWPPPWELIVAQLRSETEN